MGSGSANGGGGGGEWTRPPHNASPQIVYKIGIYGWRKRCLYVFILLLMVAVIVNLALTIWILKVMDFSVHGMGKLRILKSGIRIEGDSEFLKALYAKQIKSRKDSGLYLESSRNITLNARDGSKNTVNTLAIGKQRVETNARHFEVREPGGQLLFYADKDEVFLGAKRLKVGGSAGAVFKGSVQTPQVWANVEDLKLESPTNKLDILGTKEVKLKSPSGGIVLESLMDFKITSRSGTINLDASDICLRDINISTPAFDGKRHPDVYQLCVCELTGRLFVAPPQGNCQATSDICS